MSASFPVPNLRPGAADENVLPIENTVDSRKRGVPALVGQMLIILFLAAGCYYVISRYFVQNVTIIGSSMVPTLCHSEHYLLNRWIFHVRAPQRTDIVVIQDPSDSGFSVKRIIGTAGDDIRIAGGSVFVNGKLVREPYLSPGTRTHTLKSQPDQVYHCGRDQYFLLGDNRTDSVDSRSYGVVPRRNILGLVIH